MKKLFALLLAVLLAVCPVVAEEAATETAEETAAEIAETEAAESETPAETAAPELDPGTVIVTYDGGTVTIGDCLGYYNYLVDYYTEYAQYYLGYAPEFDAETTKLLKETSARNMTQRSLVVLEAEALGIAETITDEDREALRTRAEDDFNAYVDYYVTDEMSREAIIETLAADNLSVDTIFDDYYIQELDDLLYAHYAETAEVTDADVQALFDQKVEADKASYETDNMAFSNAMMNGTQYYWAPEGHRCVKQILIMTSEENQNEMREIYTAQRQLAEGEEDAELNERYEAAKAAILADTKEKADAVLAGLAEGKSFEELQEEYCEDPGSLSEPIKSIGYCVAQKNDGWDTAFRDTAMSLENIGDVSEPVPGLYGVYIIKYVSDITPGAIPMDTVYDELYETALQTAKDNAYSAGIEECFSKYNVQIDVSAWN